MIKKIIKDEYTNIRGATLICGYHTLSKIQSYLRQLTYVYTSQNTRLTPLTAPSAVHLKACFLSGSQHPGISV